MKKRIALVAGGFTGEIVISMKSAETVYKHLDKNKYEVYNIIIDHESWRYVDESNQSTIVDKNDFSILIGSQKIQFDAAFIIIHGSPGEDGKLQGYFDMLNIPYTTCDAITSAITMNKAYTKSIIADIKDVYVAKSMQLFDDRTYTNEQILSSLKLPLFVKPNNGGSSIGMSKVKQESELQEALQKAFKEDKQVLVEEFIEGREFTIGIVKINNQIKTLPATEIVSSKEFFDFEAKYTSGVTEEITPGRMTDEEKHRVELAMIDIYQRLNCAGVVRIDYILERNSNNMYVLEVNTVPGQSQNSIIPQQVRAMGGNMTDFYGDLLEEILVK
ncbi:MAG: D-alanine--D-alanine ligase [bacterium]|jgi:D-alanine-D-alanine ligase